jgi:hypothetical protein
LRMRSTYKMKTSGPKIAGRTPPPAGLPFILPF